MADDQIRYPHPPPPQPRAIAPWCTWKGCNKDSIYGLARCLDHQLAYERNTMEEFNKACCRAEDAEAATRLLAAALEKVQLAPFPMCLGDENGDRHRDYCDCAGDIINGALAKYRGQEWTDPPAVTPEPETE